MKNIILVFIIIGILLFHIVLLANTKDNTSLLLFPPAAAWAAVGALVLHRYLTRRK